MINFYMHDQDGQIIMTGSCPEDHLELQLDSFPDRHDLSLAIGQVDYKSQYVGDKGEIKNIPPKPAIYAKFDWKAKEWKDPRTLQEVKDDKWASIKAKRDVAEFSTFTFMGIEYDCNEVSRARIQGAVQLASIALTNEMPYSIDWTVADNSTVILDGISMVQLGLALGAFTNNLHVYAKSLRNQIYGTEDKAIIESIEWSYV